MQQIYEMDLDTWTYPAWDGEDSFIDKLELMIQLRDIAGITR